MRNQICNGCLAAVRQGFSDGTLLFCTQSCQQEFIENGNKPIVRRNYRPSRTR